MRYYTIQDNAILIADNEQALSRFYDNVLPLPSDYKQGKYIVQEGELVLNPNWEEEQAEKERQRIAKLHLTRGDVFRGLLLAKGVTRAQLRAIIEQLPEENQEQSVTKEMALIDFDEALEYYRGVALIDTVGAQLGITSEQMTKFFETNDYHKLITVEPEEEESEEESAGE